MSYNGWSNYETWNVALWLDNDRWSYNMCCKMAQEAWDDTRAGRGLTREEIARVRIAEQIREMVEEANPLAGEASMFSDLLGAALSEVDWREIAEHYLDDVKSEEEEAEETEETEGEEV